MPKMQATLFSGKGILPALPGALHVEPGKLRKSRLPSVDVFAAGFDGNVLDLLFYGNVLPLILFSLSADLIPTFRKVC